MYIADATLLPWNQMNAASYMEAVNGRQGAALVDASSKGNEIKIDEYEDKDEGWLYFDLAVHALYDVTGKRLHE